jgi:hypothetical protein
MNDTTRYPPVEFLADLDAVQAFMLAPQVRGLERVRLVFSMRYRDQMSFAYRFTRFVGITSAIESKFPALVQDKLATSEGKDGDWLPEAFLLALHEWYCSQTDAEMQAMPAPDWPEVLAIYDRLPKN